MIAALRVLVGLVFLISGLEKLLYPAQNFLYVIQGYEVLPAVLAKVAAHFFPWVEYLTAVFMILGLWLPWALRVSWLMTFSFILIVGQALIRNLPLGECGCFGELISLPLPVVFLFDSFLLILITCLMALLPKTSRTSLDEFYSRSFAKPKK